MTTMSAVWDRSVLVLQGRGGMLARIAGLTLFLPALVRAAVQATADPTAVGGAGLAGLVSIVAVIVSLWGHLALIAAASDPAVVAGPALSLAARRLPVAIGLGVLILLVVGLLFTPIGLALVGAGVDVNALAMAGSGAGSGAGSTAPAIPPGVAAFVGLYTVVFLAAALLIGARLAVLYPVVLLEQTGIGAFARAFRLTRGHGWRIVGVLLLYIVVVLVAGGAARLVIGTLAALLFGAGTVATLIAAVAAALVGTVFGVIAVVFSAQLYLSLREGR